MRLPPDQLDMLDVIFQIWAQDNPCKIDVHIQFAWEHVVHMNIFDIDDVFVDLVQNRLCNQALCLDDKS